MALREAETVVLTEEFLIEETSDEHENVEAEAEADAVKRRLDRQLGLLKTLPRGWRVERVEQRSRGVLKGHEFRVLAAEGLIRGSARVRFDGARSGVSWPGMGGGMPGHAWAHGIALMLSAIHAEASIDAMARELD